MKFFGTTVSVISTVIAIAWTIAVDATPVPPTAQGTVNYSDGEATYTITNPVFDSCIFFAGGSSDTNTGIATILVDNKLVGATISLSADTRCSSSRYIISEGESWADAPQGLPARSFMVTKNSVH